MKTVIFDFDGTIADSFDFVVDFLAKECGRPMLTGDEKNELRAMTMPAMARKLGARTFRLPRLLFKGRRQMKKQISSLQPFAGMPELIRTLQKDGHELYLLSSNTSRNINLFLKANNLNRQFIRVYGGVGLFGKSSALRRLIRDNKLVTEQCYYVGDEIRDIVASNNIGLPVIAVSWGFARADELASKKPTGIASNPEELQKLIKSA